MTQTGFNAWADTNQIVVLYPQTIKSSFSPLNPNGCWDWWGIYGSDYFLQSGKQLAAVNKVPGVGLTLWAAGV